MSIFKDAYQEWLEDLETTMKEEEVPEPDHEDDGEALASAGFGTDEDYGYEQVVKKYKSSRDLN